MFLKTRKATQWNTVIKAVVIAAFVGVTAYQVFVKRDITELWQELARNITADKLWVLALVIILMPLNWALEAGKWQVLMRPALRIPFGVSLKAVLSGIAVSLFTPNRIGEYGGRILFVPAEYNWRALLASVVGSFSQNIANIAVGLAAVLAFVYRGELLPQDYNIGMLVLLVGVLTLTFIIYANTSRISEWLLELRHPRWLDRPWRAFDHLRKITPFELMLTASCAFARYAIFSTQFVLLLWFFHVDVPVFWLFAGVAVMFLMQTSIPLPPFADVFARSELALILWAGYSLNELAVVSASFFLWIINLLIPSFFGLMAMSTVNVLASLGYEEKKKVASHIDGDSALVGVRSRRPGGHN